MNCRHAGTARRGVDTTVAIQRHYSWTPLLRATLMVVGLASCANATTLQGHLDIRLRPHGSALRTVTGDLAASLPLMVCPTTFVEGVGMGSERRLNLPLVGGLLRLRGGAKSKNHTNHNQIKKAHKNGIKRVRTHRFESTKDRDIKTWRNTKYARKGSMRLHRRNLLEKRMAQKLASAGAAVEPVVA